MLTIKHKKLFYISLFLVMLSIGFMITQSITGKISQPENDCEPDYLLEHVWYEDVSTEFAEARCKTLCWRGLHVDSIKVERLEDVKENGIEFVRLVCWCDRSGCD